MTDKELELKIEDLSVYLEYVGSGLAFKDPKANIMAERAVLEALSDLLAERHMRLSLKASLIKPPSSP